MLTASTGSVNPHIYSSLRREQPRLLIPSYKAIHPQSQALEWPLSLSFNVTYLQQKLPNLNREFGEKTLHFAVVFHSPHACSSQGFSTKCIDDHTQRLLGCYSARVVQPQQARCGCVIVLKPRALVTALAA